MTTYHLTDDQAIAAANIGLVKKRMDKASFYAQMLGQLEIRPHEEVATARIDVDGDRLVLIYNVGFARRASLDLLESVLVHLVNHLLLGHMTLNPKRYPDQWAFTVALEVSANELQHNPPPGAITPRRFRAIKADQTFDERYEQLSERKRRPRLWPPPKGGHGDAEIHAADKGKRLLIWDDHHLDEGAGTQPPQPGQQNRPDQPEQCDCEDQQTSPSPSMQPDRQPSTVIHEALRNAVEASDDKHVPPGLLLHLESIGASSDQHHAGSSSGHERHVEQGRQGQIDWKTLLQRLFPRQRQRQADYRRPPRRLPHMAGIVPARSRRVSRLRIVTVIDTSASITDEQLNQIAAELQRLKRWHDITVVECDERVRRVYPYKGHLQDVVGAGGTNLRPPFEPAFLEQHRPDLLVYFTDGGGPAPQSPPTMPVIWCLMQYGSQPVDWGHAVQMERDENDAMNP